MNDHDWTIGTYVPDYFAEKWDHDTYIKRIRDVLAAVGVPVGDEEGQ